MTQILITDNRRRAVTGSPSFFAQLVIGSGGSFSPNILAAAVAILAFVSAFPAASGTSMPAVCIFILVMGLPHGMFDYLTLRKLSDSSVTRQIALTSAYCIVAGFTWLFWQLAPFASLCVFIIIAMSHFSIDWAKEQSRLGSAAMAISMIALPAILYSSELSALFVLIGGPDAGIISQYLLLIAPVFGLVAAANILIDLTSKAKDKALRNFVLILAALILPPGIGFAVYFCLYHSPIHFSEGHSEFMSEAGIPPHFFLYMSIASAIVLFSIFVAQPLQSIDAKLIATTFQTLSILTVPHMLLPILILQRHRFLKK